MLQFIMIETGAVPSEMKRLVKPALKKGFRMAGDWWQKERLPLHFTVKGKSLYNYAPRQGEPGGKPTAQFQVKRGGKFVTRRRRSYTFRKLQLYKRLGFGKAPLPLVWSGKSRERSSTGRVTSTSTRFRVTIPSPTLNRRPEMRDEVTRVTDREAAKMANIANQELRVTLMKSRRRKVTKLV